MIFNKPVDQIIETDLMQLVNSEFEKPTLDVKRDLYPWQGLPPEDLLKKKVKFFTDLVAFANTRGGWIICGAEENDSIITNICGLKEIDIDENIRRLQQAADSGIEPRIPGLEFHQVPLSDPDKKGAVVIRIPRSFAGPHWIKETHRFHLRRSKGNDEMDLREVRAAFNLSESYVDRIKQFRHERLEAIVLGMHRGVDEEIPVQIEYGPKAVMHFIPLSFVDRQNLLQLDINSLYKIKDDLVRSQIEYRYFNLDGIVIPLTFQRKPVEEYQEYYQIFRSGAVERVVGFEQRIDGARNLLELERIEDSSLIGLRFAFAIQAALGIEMPIVIMLSLVDVLGHFLVPQRGHHYNHDLSRLRRDKILFPDIVVNHYNEDAPTLLKPIFDILWNIIGENSSESYPGGNWGGRNLRPR